MTKIQIRTLLCVAAGLSILFYSIEIRAINPGYNG